MERQEFNDLMNFTMLSSIPLREINENIEPIDLGSGCLITCNEKTFILTVAHVVESKGNWNVECEFLPDIGKIKIQNMGVIYFAEARNSKEPYNEIKIDFAYSEVPNNIESYLQKFSDVREILDSKKRIIFDKSDITSPNEEDLYSFSGCTVPDYDGWILGAKIEIHRGLIYVKSDEFYDYYKFPGAYPNCINLKGCSGAPIINQNRKITGLICGSDDEVLIKTASLRKLCPLDNDSLLTP